MYDEQGRRRFHGAFTGGYSAGYYNTVGSAEGWAPSSYVSVRDKKMGRGEEGRRRQSVQDFMDEEDGVLGGRISMAGGFGEDSVPDDAAPKGRGREGGYGGDPQMAAVHASLISSFVQARIGKRLLQSLGWSPSSPSSSQPQRRSKTSLRITSSQVPVPPPKHDVYGLGHKPFLNAPEFAAARARREEEVRVGRTKERIGSALSLLLTPRSFLALSSAG